MPHIVGAQWWLLQLDRVFAVLASLFVLFFTSVDLIRKCLLAFIFGPLILVVSELLPPKLPPQIYPWAYMAIHSLWHVLIYGIAYVLIQDPESRLFNFDWFRTRHWRISRTLAARLARLQLHINPPLFSHHFSIVSRVWMVVVLLSDSRPSHLWMFHQLTVKLSFIFQPLYERIWSKLP